MNPEDIQRGMDAIAAVERIRPLLTFGFLLVAGILVIEWAMAMMRREEKDRQVSPLIANEECKLHGRRLKDCPPESHGGGKTDDPDD